jgi:hypothetical protein
MSGKSPGRGVRKMGTTGAQMTTTALIRSELGLDNGYRNRKLVRKAAGADLGDRKETWMIIEEDAPDGGRTRFGVVALWSREGDWSYVKLVDFSMGPNGTPPPSIIDLLGTLPFEGYYTPELRVAWESERQIKIEDTEVGNFYKAVGRSYGTLERVSRLDYRGRPMFRLVKDGQVYRMPVAVRYFVEIK